MHVFELFKDLLKNELKVLARLGLGHPLCELDQVVTVALDDVHDDWGALGHHEEKGQLEHALLLHMHVCRAEHLHHLLKSLLIV